MAAGREGSSLVPAPLGIAPSGLLQARLAASSPAMARVTVSPVAHQVSFFNCRTPAVYWVLFAADCDLGQPVLRACKARWAYRISPVWVGVPVAFCVVHVASLASRVHHAAQEQHRARVPVPDEEDEGPVDYHRDGLLGGARLLYHRCLWPQLPPCPLRPPIRTPCGRLRRPTSPWTQSCPRNRRGRQTRRAFPFQPGSWTGSNSDSNSNGGIVSVT